MFRKMIYNMTKKPKKSQKKPPKNKRKVSEKYVS